MSLDAQIADFVQQGKDYYGREFRKIQREGGGTIPFSWNRAAFLAGPLWGAWRRVGKFFWVFSTLELLTLVQVARGLWMEASGEKLARYEKLMANIAQRKQQLAQMAERGDGEAMATATQIIANLQQVADQLQQQLAREDSSSLLIMGLLLFILLRIFEGFYANIAYEKKYLLWRVHSNTSQAGVSWNSLGMGALLLLLIWPMAIFRFSVLRPDQVLSDFFGGTVSITRFPVGQEFFFALSQWGDRGFDWIANRFTGAFDGVTQGIALLVEFLETLLIATPWPVVMVFLTVIAFRLAGPRTAIFTVAAMAYLAFMGLWELSMITVALVGAATTLCLALGIPLGIWFGHNQRAYALAGPLLDFMQTMPAFVYLIPVIAFFGTGKPSGVLATLIFAMPPVVRLTALGIRGVPESIREAAISFGCSPWQLLRYVEIPLAMPSLMAGVNQTIMMGLSMVVIASLIGAEGLGALILEALQYAAKGQGLFGGIAILLCAMAIDRIAQGLYHKGKH